MEMRKVGEVFEYQGVKLVAEEVSNDDRSCNGCFFKDTFEQHPFGCGDHYCLPEIREDGKNTIYKEVK